MTGPADLAAALAEVARLRLELEVILLTVEDEAYKVTVEQQPCRHTKALNEIHDYARDALSYTTPHRADPLNNESEDGG